TQVSPSARRACGRPANFHPDRPGPGGCVWARFPLSETHGRQLTWGAGARDPPALSCRVKIRLVGGRCRWGRVWVGFAGLGAGLVLCVGGAGVGVAGAATIVIGRSI